MSYISPNGESSLEVQYKEGERKRQATGGVQLFAIFKSDKRSNFHSADAERKVRALGRKNTN